ncbi:valine-tRNA ligase isoform X3 [Carex rostrata]
MRRNQSLCCSSSSIHPLFLLSFILLSSIPGSISSRLVTLGSIEIFNAHEWLPSKPIVYFSCKGENKTILPDVKATDFLYSFKGQESWQPLTELPEKKCKRCGIYEQDTFKSDDVFDEWEMCSDDFVKGKYIHIKEKEFNATFICSDCGGGSAGSHNSTTAPDRGEPKKKKNVAMVVVVSLLASSLTVIAAVYVYKYWQRRKREQDQLRFLQLFEENDEIEDEIALGHVI